ncbi:hypothetical protein B0I37DRAFT_391365 [Chaetomium sp. MPI-CAGE-AT-0009]|nr:hypothetical protein B0I37DRAFT_391365 [Chaetomium sp. MPI-CAGE-AT-0009]
MAPASGPQSPLNDLTPLMESLLIGTSAAAQFVRKPRTERDPSLNHKPEVGPKPVIESNSEQPRCRRCKSPRDSDRSLREVPCCGTSICDACADEALNERLQNDLWNHLDSQQWVGCLANACLSFSAAREFDLLYPVAEVPSYLAPPQQRLKNAERAREALGRIRPRPAHREWNLAQRLHKALTDHKLMSDWSQAPLDMQSASSFPVRSGFLTQLVPIMTSMLKTESKTCTSCSTVFEAVETSNEAAWAYVTTAFPGDWTWMVLGCPSKQVLPECAGKHSLDICSVCLPKLMFSGLEFLDAVSGNGNYRFVCPMCKHVLSPVQVERIARLIDPNRAPAMLSGFSISTHSTATSLLGSSDKPKALVGWGHRGGGDGGGLSKSADSESAARNESLMAAVVTKKPNVRWDDVAGLAPAKHELQRAIIFPARFPNLYDDKRRPSGAILLYGPPGTGKSYLAKAVATEADHTFFSISPGDVVSKWVGESEKLIRQLFALARENKPSLIFIDEIDALCASREDGGGGGREHSARMKTELLVQLDGLPSDSDNSGITVLAATNLPWALDPAFRRRFEPRLHIPLPDRAARRRLFEVHSSGERWGGVLGKGDVDVLAGMTEGFSGSDVAKVVRHALSAPLGRVQAARWFRVERGKDGEDMYAPCEAGDEGAGEMTWEKVPENRLLEPPVTADDFKRVLRDRKVKASVGVGELQSISASRLLIMRLLRTNKLEVVEFQGQDIPHYAILSHTWAEEEVSLQDVQQGLAHDVDAESDPRTPSSSFRMSRWFTRGWTLQELIAPAVVYFYGAGWKPIGSREKLLDVIVQITRINPAYFTTGDLSQFCAAQKMSWAANRNTTRPEDEAYCLLGLFDINMPLLYGEGKRAFQRLQEEILRQSEDDSLFAHRQGQLLAASPRYFRDCSRMLGGLHFALLNCGTSEWTSLLLLREQSPGVFVKLSLSNLAEQAILEPEFMHKLLGTRVSISRAATTSPTGLWDWRARNDHSTAREALRDQMRLVFEVSWCQYAKMTPIVRPALPYDGPAGGLASDRGVVYGYCPAN